MTSVWKSGLKTAKRLQKDWTGLQKTGLLQSGLLIFENQRPQKTGLDGPIFAVKTNLNC
jgi:hypothetical protein